MTLGYGLPASHLVCVVGVREQLCIVVCAGKLRAGAGWGHHRLPDCAGACICVRGDAEDEGEGTGWPGGERQRVQLQGTRESCAALRFWTKEGDRATVAAEATRGAH